MYNWIETTFNVSEGLAQGLALVISLAVVLVLFGLFIFIIKRLLGANAPQGRSRQPRVAIMDSTTLDTRRRLLLIRRDNVEHLILVGGPSDVVIEQNIVRHAPLATGQNRGGTYAAQPHLAGSIKSPIAPGPDIPMTPEDSIPAPHPAKRQVTAAQMPETPPVERLGTSNIKQPETAASQMSGTAPHHPVSNVQPPVPGATTSMAVAQSESPAAKPISQPKSNPAADLLRAATKNAFGSNADKPSLPRSDRAHSVSAISQPAAIAPTVKPDTSPAPSASAVENRPPEKTGSSFNSLNKSFSPKDRPSYGNQKITPPASGPAARAKTALSKPMKAEVSSGRIEPVMAVNQTEDASEDNKTRTIERQQNQLATAPVTPTSIADKDVEDATDQTVATFLTSTPAPLVKASEEKPEDVVAVTTADAHIGKTENENLIGPSDSAPNHGGSIKVQEQADAQSLAERNPIEDEMAKILDEVGGQSKQ